jgi:two-component system chemotaxis response regulator CheB
MGGLKALQTLLWGVSGNFPLPLVIVQHRRRDSELGLCAFLRQHCRLPLSEPEDKEPILGNHVYLAPRDYHLLIEHRSFSLSTDAPVAFARPSIDVLFESAAEAFQENVIGVILTGGNQDGAKGLARVKLAGGLTIVEDPDSASSHEMPRAAIDLMKVDHVLPLGQIALTLQQLVGSTSRSYGT